ncbi:hypothetical protein Nepgr_027971 [Nepenthes gracilis]|uniref:SAM domain-containing protein n=1 Tax=Nepenthes gracilis TaxID=150966 RepID=A0AAD3Y1Y9_NEPGR|nr:hypothetical protein Nepgr_027971 [Nepenthes gracilis]
MSNASPYTASLIDQLLIRRVLGSFVSYCIELQMSQSSRSQVTITLGRNGPVVKKGGEAVSDDDKFSDFVRPAGRKRSVRERLGSNADNSFGDTSQLGSKRQRTKNDTVSLSTSSLNEMRLGKGDLRFKLMQKNMFRQIPNSDLESNIDLRDRLCRETQLSVDSKTICSPEAKTIPPPQAKLYTRRSMVEPRDTSMLGQVPSSKSTSLLHAMNPYRTSYSFQTWDNPRRRSPDRMVCSSTSRVLSPERNMEDSRRMSFIRAFDDGKSNLYMRNDAHSPPRPASSAPYLTKSALPAASAKPVAPPISQYVQTSRIVSRVPYMMDEHPSVESLLKSLGLEKYIISFKHEEVDMHALRQMGDTDLKELGIPMGPRKKILQAVSTRPKMIS